MSDTRFDQQPLLDDPFDLVVPEGHRLAGRARVDLAEAAREAWIAPVEDSPCRPHVLSACGAAGFTPRSSITPSTGMPAPTSWPTGSASPSSRAWPI